MGTAPFLARGTHGHTLTLVSQGLGARPEHRVRNRALTRWPIGVVLRHPTVTSSHNGSLQRKEGGLLVHQLGTCHHPPFWHSSLLTHHCAHHGLQRSHNPALCHQQHPRWCSHSEREHLLFPRQNCLSSITRQHRQQAQEADSLSALPNTTATPSCLDPGRLGWEQGPGAGWGRELATFTLARILQVPSSATQEECFSWGYWNLLSLGASCNGKIFVAWLRFRMPEATGPAKEEKRD